MDEIQILSSLRRGQFNAFIVRESNYETYVYSFNYRPQLSLSNTEAYYFD